MISNLELYGTEDVPRVPKDVCNARLELLEERLAMVLSRGYLKWDNHEINKIKKAQRFWTCLRDGEEPE